MSLRPRAVILIIVAVVLAACSTGGGATTAPAPHRSACDRSARDWCSVHARRQRRRADPAPAPDGTAPPGRRAHAGA